MCDTDAKIKRARRDTCRLRADDDDWCIARDRFRSAKRRFGKARIRTRRVAIHVAETRSFALVVVLIGFDARHTVVFYFLTVWLALFAAIHSLRQNLVTLFLNAVTALRRAHGAPYPFSSTFSHAHVFKLPDAIDRELELVPLFVAQECNVKYRVRERRRDDGCAVKKIQ